MKMFKNNKKGFSLVELIVAVTILAILAAIAIPVASQLLSTSSENVDDANLALIKTSVQAYYAKNEAYPSSTQLTAYFEEGRQAYLRLFPGVAENKLDVWKKRCFESLIKKARKRYQALVF